MAVLEVTNLSASYGSVIALEDVSFNVEEGELVAIIGSNGAGKSTLLSCISGVMSYTGSITYNGEEISKLGTDKIVQEGIVQVPEGRLIFPELSVMENLKMGAYSRKRRDNIQPEVDVVFDLFPRLKERVAQKGGSLSGGEQQMLAVGRALMAKPKLLLMDEPSMGLAPVIVADIFRTIERLHEEKITIVLVEQNARLALRHADRAYVLETGEILLTGTGEELANNPRVQELYLGG
jgi:branched-chain amino acid transport system ATP-binding protein